ncbi:hypothetical protein [Mycoplasma seminis]|uniref:Uncharacterized protein n=1 Tax=Mycoplasma seminis TaxID=512749 RepID=A0ABY9HCJ1_9MOLU|nr:hypothetical protein [Mycoplasma seminis]WLP85398.1 hypothetical protein Q8852_03695 [Mycoplasma seminis]
MTEKQKSRFLKLNICVSFLYGCLLLFCVSVFDYFLISAVLSFMDKGIKSKGLHNHWMYILFIVVIILWSIPSGLFMFCGIFEIIFNSLYRFPEKWRFLKENRFPKRKNKLELWLYKYVYLKPKNESNQLEFNQNVNINKVKKIIMWFFILFCIYYSSILVIVISLLIYGLPWYTCAAFIFVWFGFIL